MGYPGDTGDNGGRPSDRAPRQPHGPGGAESAPVSWDDDQNRFAPGSFGAPPGGLAAEPPHAASGHGDPNGTAALGDPNGTAAFGGPPSFGGSPQGFDDAPQGFGGAGHGDHDGFGGPQQGFGDGNGFGGGGGFGPGEPGPGGPAGPGGPEGFGPGGGFDQHVAGPPPGKAKKRNLPLIIGGAAVAGVVLIGGGVAAASMFKDDPKPKGKTNTAANKPAPTAASTPSSAPSPSLSPVKLKSRATDPSPLTLSEIFGKSAFRGAGEKYKRTGWNAAKTCTGAVGGTSLTASVKKGGCSQVLRATYTRGDGKLIGTVGVFNLKTETAAKTAVRAAAAKDAYLKPLPGAGNTKKIGTGLALGTAEARGHYLVMTWVQRPDGKKIADSAHKDVSDFGQQVIQGSGLGVALHYRETEGKPYRS
ncbi:hypothetical protein AB0J52_06960 [Spirillospora sp. NPDC049652]